MQWDDDKMGIGGGGGGRGDPTSETQLAAIRADITSRG